MNIIYKLEFTQQAHFVQTISIQTNKMCIVGFYKHKKKTPTLSATQNNATAP